MLEHGNLVNLIQYQLTLTSLPKAAKVLQYTTISFDVCYQEIFSTLLSGGQLYLIREETKKSPEKLFAFIEAHQLDILYLPAALIKFLFNEPDYAVSFPRCVKHIVTAGEQLIVNQRLQELLRRYQIALHNHYGPSETHVVTTYTIEPNDDKIKTLPPIGRPIANTAIYILGPKGRPQPVGVTGELYVSGDSVGKGYWNREALTTERFVADPFTPGRRMYRTGDLARWLPDGTIEYAGRLDHQVKIRGFRIELSEVESQLLALNSIQEAAVLAKKDEHGQQELYAYVAGSADLQIQEVREELSRHLPHYMIPAFFVPLERIPLTPNGKVDRKALPKLESSIQSKDNYEAPRTHIEEQLVSLWEQILKMQGIGIKDDFFDLGGHSLRATVLVSQIYKMLHVDIQLREVFQFPTIEQLARVISEKEQLAYAAIEKVEERPHYPVSSAQKRLYILQQMNPAATSYNMPGIVSIEGNLDRERLEHAFVQLIHRHEALRTSFDTHQGQPVQRISKHVTFNVEFAEASEAEIDTHIHQFVRSFDLKQSPLLRVKLISIQVSYHLLMFDMHHIISDGVSMNILVQEFAQLYAGMTLEPLRLQYKDYAVWQQDAIANEQMKRQEAFWLDVFKGELPELNLPIDFERGVVEGNRAQSYKFVLDSELMKGLNEVALSNQSTLYMVLLASFSVLLSKYSGQDDIIIGTPIAGRRHADLEPLIGMFVNTIALRHFPKDDKAFDGYIKEVKQHTLDAYDHQDYPFDALVQMLELKPDKRRNPLFDVMFIMQNTEVQDIEIESLTIKPYQQQQQNVKMDLALSISFEQDQWIGCFEYNRSLFKSQTIEDLASHFLKLLTQVHQQPTIQIKDIQLIEAKTAVEEDMFGFDVF